MAKRLTYEKGLTYKKCGVHIDKDNWAKILNEINARHPNPMNRYSTQMGGFSGMFDLDAYIEDEDKIQLCEKIAKHMTRKYGVKKSIRMMKKIEGVYNIQDCYKESIHHIVAEFERMYEIDKRIESIQD
jgi:hypothetical protein